MMIEHSIGNESAKHTVSKSRGVTKRERERERDRERGNDEYPWTFVLLYNNIS